MTTKQERKLKMYLVVREFLTHNEDVMKKVPHFTESFSEFKSLTDQINLTSVNQVTSRKGIAIEKKHRRQNLISIALDTSRKLAAFAKVTDDLRLLYQVHFSLSDLEDMKDVDLKSQVEIIYDEAETKIEILQDYDISKESQKIFRGAIDAFDESFTKPRLGITEKSQATMKLRELMGKAYSVLQDIDLEAGIIMYEKTDFYIGYKSARKLVYTRAGMLSLRATVKEMLGGTPVKGAVFRFTPERITGEKNDRHTVIVKKSARKGGIQLKNMPEGNYKVVINKPGYREKITNVIIADGERSELNVEMEKA
ncbi:MAG: carboxypeptidase-like regulatory domain-containing protein [Bacteroidales bacterium]